MIELRLCFFILAHLLKSHQLHQSQTLKSPVQTIIQPNQSNIVQNDIVPTKTTDGVVTQQHQLPPPKRLLQNFVTPTPTPPTPPMPRANKKEPMSVKFEPFGEKSSAFLALLYKKKKTKNKNRNLEQLN